MREPIGDSEGRRVEERSANEDTNPSAGEEEAKGVLLIGTASGSGLANLTVSLTTSLTASHIQSAALFARQAGTLEGSYDGSDDEVIRADHRAYVTGAVFAAVAFLETTINEFFDFNPLKMVPLEAVWQQLLSGKPGTQVLRKYQLALQLAEKAKFDEAQAMYEHADALIKLRNALVHYEPKQHTATGAAEQKDLPRLERTLRGKFSGMNPLYKPGSHFLHRYLGYGCARWAVESAWMFTDEFFRQVGTQAPYEHVRHRLATA